MSIRHPKERQIRLPFSVSRPGRSEGAKRICGICRKKDSQYTCPRCNVAYCSLACFKDQSHVQCSEPFYKSTVMDSIAGDPKAGLEEKKAMLEMLKRFEDAQVEGEDVLGELEREDEVEDELLSALDGIDLDDIDSNKLFHLLPQSHRDAFLAALRNPESEETKALLVSAASGEGEVEDGIMPDVLPWWESDSTMGEDESSTDGRVDYAATPRMISEEVVGGIHPPEGTGVKLAYNAIAIALAYFHLLLSSRLPSLDSPYLVSQAISPEGIKLDFAALLPFLTNPKSTIRYTSVREAWTAVWEAIGKSLASPSTNLLIRLLSLVPPLLQPSIISGEPTRISLLLSDVYTLFSTPKAGTAGARKLAFYLAAMKGMSRNDWLRLKAEVEKEVGKLKDEVEDDADGLEEPEPDRPALKI